MIKGRDKNNVLVKTYDNLNEDTKIIFFSMFGNLSSTIVEKQDLNRALLLGGRNVTRRKLDELWSSSSKCLNLQEFHDLCEKVAITTEEDMLKAFKKIDFDNDGLIDHDELIRILMETGDKMTQKEVDDFLKSFAGNKDQGFDYKEYVAMVLKTQEESYRAAERRYVNFKKSKGSRRRSEMLVEEDDVVYGSDLNDDDDDNEKSRSSLSSKKYGIKSAGHESKLWTCPGKLPVLEKPKNFKEWSVCKRYGSFYFGNDEDGSVVVKTQHFVVEVQHKTLVWISVEPIWTKESDLNRLIEKNDSHMDLILFVLNEQGKLVSYSHDKGAKGKSSFTVELKTGRYWLVAYTSGARFKIASENSRVKGRRSSFQGVKLVTQMGESYLITTAFKETLNEIFKAFDTRGRGLLNKKDFELYTKLTCGDDEELNEEDWSIVLERVHTSEGQITEQGFVELHELDAMDSFGEEADFWDSLVNLGYDRRLQLVKASHYVIEVYTEFGDAKVNVDKISTFSKEIQQPIIDLVKNHGEKFKAKTNKDVVVHVLLSQADAFVVVENQSSRTVVVTVDCTKSENLISHRDSLNYTSKVSAKSSSIFHHLLPVRTSLKWFFQANESVTQ